MPAEPPPNFQPERKAKLDLTINVPTLMAIAGAVGTLLLAWNNLGWRVTNVEGSQNRLEKSVEEIQKEKSYDKSITIDNLSASLRWLSEHANK